MQEGLRPITELTNAAESGEAFLGISECYRSLYEKAGIMHCDIDISRDNLMYRKISGKVYGVLTDSDLFVLLANEPCWMSKQRIGTEPYMAVELLVTGPPPPHIYLESLFMSLRTSCVSNTKGRT
ncbi:hypothetical protein B0H15DRAFT_23253 [Mycena belliarum]|uniref:Fungal-type protein kinase domain-containing protein n=1 Tax=Mycena belliarum TaxID=1033014 RepID=A0AAD6UJS7_9AGAR|nr:hypothetical protein B0H15DRAFT_23253 [Mycena belliae]